MKVFKFLAVIVVSLIFLVGLTSIAMSAEGSPSAKAKVEIQKTGPVGGSVVSQPCPTGWHFKSGSTTGTYSCVPNKPAPMTCAPKHHWVDNSEAGCWVGCAETLY